MASETKFLPASDIQSEKKGKITACILSAYDLPDCEHGNGRNATAALPLYVSMELLGKEVRTGPPSARRRDRNSFKFVSEKQEGVSSSDKQSTSSSTNGGASNEISISAPLELLYPQTAVFKVVLDNKQALVAEVELSTVLHINEPKWLILHLEPEYKTKSPPRLDDTETDEHGPTLRLKLCLIGPFRPEVRALLSMSQTWFSAMDGITAGSSAAWSAIISTVLPKQFPRSVQKIFLVPTVPLAAASAVLLPILLGLLTIGLPFFLPIIVGILTVAASLGIVGAGVYLSSSTGRNIASKILGPVATALTATTAGQQMIYETGPRPSPVALAEIVLPDDMIGQLVVSLLIDFIGSSSYLLPGVGEAFDVTWAPIQTILLMAMYDKAMPSLKYISFIEEIMPFTDVLPSGTLGWVRKYSPLVMEEGLKRVPDHIRDIVRDTHHGR